MPTYRTMRMTGWGRAVSADMQVMRPERAGDLAALFDTPPPKGVLAVGLSRSYGDVGLNDGGRGALMIRLNRLLSFEPDTGLLIAEAGVSFLDLMTVFLPRGYMPPVTPGTAFATLGGALANDVHGKNHDRIGSFGDHVEWIEVLTPDGRAVRCSDSSNKALFRATIGGLGLTGIIRKVALRMMPVDSRLVEVEERRIESLDAFINALTAARDTHPFSVGWIDAMARGAALGRGILELARFSEADSEFQPVRRRRVPLDFPGFALNSLSIRAFNEAYFRHVPAAGRIRRKPLPVFFYPLDALEAWNRIYGKRGFYQFQCAIPDDAAKPGIRKIMTAVSDSRRGSFLAVIKTLGGRGRGLLSFPIKGVTLALDFPKSEASQNLIRYLHGIVRDHGGRVYLAKDALLSAEDFDGMYDAAGDMRSFLAARDPDRIMQSDLARRLGLVAT